MAVYRWYPLIKTAAEAGEMVLLTVRRSNIVFTTAMGGGKFLWRKKIR